MESDADQGQRGRLWNLRRRLGGNEARCSRGCRNFKDSRGARKAGGSRSLQDGFLQPANRQCSSHPTSNLVKRKHENGSGSAESGLGWGETVGESRRQRDRPERGLGVRHQHPLLARTTSAGGCGRGKGKMGERGVQTKSADTNATFPDECWNCFPVIHRLERTRKDPEQLDDLVREAAEAGERERRQLRLLDGRRMLGIRLWLWHQPWCRG